MPSITAKFGSSGPIVDLWIGVSHPRQRLLERLGLPVPPALRLPMIIDTGADTTMVNDQHMRSLMLDSKGTRGVLTSTSDLGATSCDTFDVSLRVATFGDPPLVVPALEILARPLFNHSIEGMVGRDVLEKVKFTFDGPAGRWRLDY